MSQREKEKVLFICTHNSARSQMAEGLLRHLYGDHYEAHSAGTEPGYVNPFAIKAMADIGIDISNHYSKSLNVYLDQPIDYVITVCDNAKETCPVFPSGKNHHHKSFQDPSATEGTEDQILETFRAVRDEIKVWLEEKFGKRGK